jgi:competence protein ComEC
VVLPALRHLGVRRLNLLVVTHRDIDHAGGVASVLKGLPVRATLSSLEPSHPLRRFPVKHETCQRGQRWEWDGVRFEVLHPFGHEPRQIRPNLISCVLRVEDAQGRSVLVTGDIERDQEAALVQAPDSAQALRSDALIVPHHGSKTSSTEPFLQSVQPQWAVAQAGYRNRHGHPASLVVERYRALDIPLRDSPWCGAWFWNGEGAPECWRQRAARHWHDVRQD